MSVTGVGLNQGNGSSSWRSTVRQASQDIDQLYQSLQAGNLSAAQQAYSDFVKVQAGSTGAAAPATAAGAAPSAVTSDWSALGMALQSGDLASAQSALDKLQQDAQVAWQSHLQDEVKNAQAVYALMQGAKGAAPATASTSSLPTPGSIRGDLVALNQALQSGDSAAAQKLLAQLEQDLQATAQASDGRGGHHHHRAGTPPVTTVLPDAAPPVAADSRGAKV